MNPYVMNNPFQKKKNNCYWTTTNKTYILQYNYKKTRRGWILWFHDSLRKICFLWVKNDLELRYSVELSIQKITKIIILIIIIIIKCIVKLGHFRNILGHSCNVLGHFRNIQGIFATLRRAFLPHSESYAFCNTTWFWGGLYFLQFDHRLKRRGSVNLRRIL